MLSTHWKLENDKESELKLAQMLINKE